MMCAGWLGDDVWLSTMWKRRAWAACVEQSWALRLSALHDLNNLSARGRAISDFVGVATNFRQLVSGAMPPKCQIRARLPVRPPDAPEDRQNPSGIQGCKFMLNLQMVRRIRLISRNVPNQTTNDLVVFMTNCPGRKELSLTTSNWSARWFGAVRPLWLPRCHTPCRSVTLRVLLPDPPSCQLLPIGCVAT